MEYHRLDLVELGIESFEGLDKRSEHFLLINLQRNKLTDFEHFGTHPDLSELLLQHNQIHSFRGLTKQASLRLLCLQGCPIAAHPYYRLMALLTVGLSIEVIDGLPITSQERHIAKSLGCRAALAVSYGWLLDLHPRTVDDYDAIIREHKRLRKDERRQAQGLHRISLGSVLTDLSKRQKTRGYDAASERQLEEQQRTITRLARRVALLEGQLTESAQGHVVPMLPPNQLETASFDDALSTSGGFFSAAELAQLDTVCFSHGVQLRHNLSAPHGALQRVCVQLDHATLTLQAFLTRETLVQLPLRALRVRHLRPLTLLVEDEVGGALGLVFNSLSLLHTVYKTFFVLSSRPIPQLSVMTQRQLQEIAQAAEMRPKTIAASTLPATPDNGPSTLRVSFHEAEDQPSVAEKSAVALDGGNSQKPIPTIDSSPAPVKLDNVEDVPPLPAAFLRVSTTGSADSHLFSVDRPRPNPAQGVAQSSEVFKSNSKIEFHSVTPSNKESSEGNADAAKSPEQVKTAQNQKGKMFSTLLVDTSSTLDSVDFHVDGTKSNGENSVVVEGARTPEATPPIAPAAVPPTAPPSKAPLAPRPSVAVAPRHLPRKSIKNRLPASAAASTAPRNPASTPTAPPTTPPRPPLTRFTNRSSRISSISRETKSDRGGGESSITFPTTDAAQEEENGGGEGEGKESSSKRSVVNATPTAAAKAAPARFPSRFGALKIDSDSDSDKSA